MKNCIVAQSGGPTAAINASLVGILEENAISGSFDKVYGALNGITGIFDKRFLCLDDLCGKIPSFLDKLKITPAMYLGSCRYKLPSPTDDPASYEKIFDTFEEMEVDSFFYIGGNDSMDTVLKLSSYAAERHKPVKVLGIPKTIDNDLMHTDHTPGFGSAAKYIATCLREIWHDTMIYHVKSVTIVEIMGRDAGWLTAASALAREDETTAPHLIYLPERPFSVPRFLSDVHHLLDVQDNVVVAVSEGIRDKDGAYISASVSTSDTFGHSQLSGAGKALELLVKEAFGVKVRSIEINTLQRCAAHLLSQTDQNEAMQLGAKAVQSAVSGLSGHMMVIDRLTNDPYTTAIATFPIEKIANGVRSVPLSFINNEGNDVTEEMLIYLRPLILGEPVIHYENGLPEYLSVAHLIK